MGNEAPYTKLSLFEISVLYHPTPAEREDSEVMQRTQLILEPRSVLAKDEGHAATIAARAIPEKYADRLDRCEVGIRPF